MGSPKMQDTATHPHIGLAASVERLSDRVNQITADAEITDFHFARALDEDVGGLDVAMDHRQLFF